MNTKRRLSASVDAALLAQAEGAVARGEVASVSAWVNEAFRQKVDHDRRLAALDAFLDAFEAEHGEITDDEIAEATKRTRANATVVRAAQSTKAKSRTRAATAAEPVRLPSSAKVKVKSGAKSNAQRRSA